MQFLFTDAWLLHSVLSTEKNDAGAHLKDVIAYADYTNHAVMTYTEFSSARNKLTLAGLLKEEKNVLHSTAEVRNWFAEKFSKKVRMNFEKEIQKLEEYLILNYAKKIAGNTDSLTDFPEEEFKNAVDQYLVTA